MVVAAVDQDNFLELIEKHGVAGIGIPRSHWSLYPVNRALVDGCTLLTVGLAYSTTA